MPELSDDSRTPPSRLAAWSQALGIWVVGCLILGLGCFVLVGNWLRAGPDRFWSAVGWQLSFGVGLSVILGLIATTPRYTGLTLAELGWRKPTSKAALVCGVLLGLFYVSGVYAGILNDPAMAQVDPFALHWVRFALIPLGVLMAIAEETMMRGFFMTSLAQARVPTWAQIILSGGCSAVYHSLHNPTWIGFIPSFVLFSLHAVLYVSARRSLTPTIVAHSMYHVLCAPYLLMFAMAQSAA